MSDWLVNLHDLHDLYTGRTRWTSARVEAVLAGFLYHVPNHIAAAAMIMLDFPVSDIFDVEAVEGKRALAARKKRRK